MSGDLQTAPAVAEPRWLSADEQRAWRSYLDMQSRLSARLGRELQERCGLSLSEFAVLVQLSEHVDNRMRVLELARGISWEKSRLSHQLTRMQQRGLIERSNCAEDRRGSFVVLTAKGREAVETAAPVHVESVRTYLFDELTAQQVGQLESITGAVSRRLESECTGQTLCDSGATSDEPAGICD